MIKLLLFLLPFIIQIESEGDPSAYRKSELAAGVLQIRPIMLDDVNRILKRDAYTLKDRYDREKSIEMFMIIMKHYKCDTILKVCRKWNGRGPGHKAYMLKIIRRMKSEHNKPRL